MLGIETSCDETGLALYASDRGLISQVLHSQVARHAPFGGVVPELASRDHIRYLIPLLDQLLAQAGCRKQELAAVAYTKGPGLIGALLVGACFARSLAYALAIPCYGVHHLEAHLQAVMLCAEQPDYPFVVLLVSGGHTQLLLARSAGDYQLLGETLDDAVGEAFDKVAKLLGLTYPGGPKLAELATQGTPGVFHFPRPMVDRPNCDFSFSGLKTHVAQVRRAHPDDRHRADIAHAFEEAVCETLCRKSLQALAMTNCQRLVVAGGVGANRRLRAALQELSDKHQFALYFPPPAFCTDNGAMVAVAGALAAERHSSEPLGVEVRARWPLT